MPVSCTIRKQDHTTIFSSTFVTAAGRPAHVAFGKGKFIGDEVVTHVKYYGKGDPELLREEKHNHKV